MATFLISDLLKDLLSLHEEGEVFTEVMYDDSDNEPSIEFNYPEGEPIYAIVDDVVEFDPSTTLMPYACFTFDEVEILYNSVCNALTFYKERLSSKDCGKDERNMIKRLSVGARNMKARLERIDKHVRNKEIL